MIDVSPIVLDEFIAACHDVEQRGLVRCSSGNLSRRLNGDRMLATASRSWLESISREQVSVCGIADLALLEGPKATVEIGFHAEILRRRPDVNVVLHFQTPRATALACRPEEDIDFFVIPEIPYYIGHIARVHYLPPGTTELAEAVSDAAREHDMILMGNHGVTTVAKDYAHAIQNAEFFELACEVILCGGDRVRPLPEEEIRALLEQRSSKTV